MQSNTDEVKAISNIFVTSDYGKFKTLPGNRFVDKSHVKLLTNRMKEQNLNPWFPILVNENFEVIDGQHRLRALEELKYPVYYEIRQGLNIDSTIQLNSGTRNWSWKDYCQSFADRGNVNYQKFWELYQEFKTQFNILYFYSLGSGGGSKRFAAAVFNVGNFVIPNYELTHKLLSQYSDILDVAGIPSTREFALACYRFMRMPYYNHMKMLEKVETKGARLNDVYFINDFVNALEEIWRS